MKTIEKSTSGLQEKTSKFYCLSLENVANFIPSYHERKLISSNNHEIKSLTSSKENRIYSRVLSNSRRSHSWQFCPIIAEKCNFVNRSCEYISNFFELRQKYLASLMKRLRNKIANFIEGSRRKSRILQTTSEKFVNTGNQSRKNREYWQML